MPDKISLDEMLENLGYYTSPIECENSNAYLVGNRENSLVIEMDGQILFIRDLQARRHSSTARYNVPESAEDILSVFHTYVTNAAVLGNSIGPGLLVSDKIKYFGVGRNNLESDHAAIPQSAFEENFLVIDVADDAKDRVLREIDNIVANDEKVGDDDLVGKLILNGVPEWSVYQIAANIQEAVSGKPVDEKSKNFVYELSTNEGCRKIVKFQKNGEQAYFGNLMNYHLSRREGFQGRIASTDMEFPVRMEIDGEKYFMTVQDYVVDNGFDDLLKQGRKGVMTYLNAWAKSLADFHYHATQVANDLGVSHKANSCFKPISLDKIQIGCKMLGIPYDMNLLMELQDSGIESGDCWIHQDFRSENRRGSVVIDSDNGGFGNHHFDLIALMTDAKVMDQYKLTMDDMKSVVRTYATRYMENTGASEPVDMKSEEDRFIQSGLVYMTYFAGYLASKGDASEHEVRSMMYKGSLIPLFQKEINF